MVDIGGFILMLAWVFLAYGHWLRVIAFVAVFIVFAIVRTKVAERYLKTGEAVRVPLAKEKTKFVGKMPVAMRLARASFWVAALMMVVFGFAPLSDKTAQGGIIGCVLALVAVAILNISLEGHYVRTGAAVVIDLTETGVPKENQS